MDNQGSIHIFSCASIDYISTVKFPAAKDQFVPLMLLDQKVAIFFIPSFIVKRYVLFALIQFTSPAFKCHDVYVIKTSKQA